MSNYNQSSQYIPGVPIPSYNSNINYNQNTQYVPGVPPQNIQPMNNYSVNPPINSYNTALSYPVSSGQPIGFNSSYNPNCAPINSYYAPSSGVYGASTTAGYGPPISTGGFDAPPFPSGGYGAPSLNSAGYGAPPLPSGSYNAPPYKPGSYGAPPISSNVYGSSNPMSGGYSAPSNIPDAGYNVSPSAPFDSGMVNDSTYIKRCAGEMAGFQSKAEVKESNVVPQPVPRKGGNSNSSTNNNKSEDYQKGLDKLAALMGDDVPITDSKLSENRAKYDLNKS